MPKSRSSFSGTNPHTTKLVEFYGIQRLFSSIVPLSSGFPGFEIAHAVQTRIKITLTNIGFTSKLLRKDLHYATKSLTTNAPREIVPIIELKNLYDNVGKNQKIRVLVTGENGLDLQKLGEYITYNWAKDHLWVQFDMVIRADLSTLISKVSSPTPYSLERLLSESLGSASSTLTPEEISKILGDKSIRPLIILNGYQTISHLLQLSEYAYINSILRSASQHNLIVTVKSYLATEAANVLNPNIILEDTGLTSSKDIEKYLENNLEPEAYRYLISLFHDNQDFYEICKSPSMLEMFCYILIEGKQLGLRSTQGSTTISSVYYDMVFLLGSKYAEKYIKHQGEVFSYPIVQFMQELAFKSPAGGNVISERLFLEILAPYSDAIVAGLPEGTDPVELVKEFGLIILDQTSNQAEKKYIFISFVFHEFMAAFHLKNLLASPEEIHVKEAQFFISLGCDKIKYLQTMKFLSGSVSMERDERTRLLIMHYLWDSIISSNEEILKIGGDAQIILMMNLLSQAIRHGELDEFVPTKITDYLDSNILRNLDQWGSHLVTSQYSSNTIIDELSYKLMGIKSEFLQATSVLGFLKIKDIGKKKEIAATLMSKINSADIEVVESAINSLQLMLDLPEVKSFFLAVLLDKRESAVLVAMEVVGVAGDGIFVNSLLNKLKDQNSLIVIGAIDALKNMYHLRSLREIIIDGLIGVFGTKRHNNELILNKLIGCLKHYQYEALQIHGDLAALLKKEKDSDLPEVYRAITSLKDLVITAKILNHNSIIDEILDKYYSKFVGLRSNPKYYSHRANIIKAMGEMYEKADQDHRTKIHTLLEKNIDSRSEVVQRAVIEAFGIIFSFVDNKVEIFRLVYESFTVTKFFSAKYLASEVISRMKGLLLIEDAVFITIIDSIFAKISLNSESEFAIPAIQTVGRLYSSTAAEKVNTILTINYVREDIKSVAIEVVGEIFGRFDQVFWSPLWQYIKLQIQTGSSEKVKIATVIAMGKIYPHIVNQYGLEVKTHLKAFLLDQNSDVIKDVAVDVCLNIYRDNLSGLKTLLEQLISEAQNQAVKKAAMYSIGGIVGKTDLVLEDVIINKVVNLITIDEMQASLLLLNKILHKVSTTKLVEITDFGKDAKARAKVLEADHIKIIEDLVDKYADNSKQVTIEDQTILNNLYQVILLRGLQTSSTIMRTGLFNLILKAKFSDAQILDFVDFELNQNCLLKDKQRIIEVFKTLFYHHHIVDKLIERSQLLERQTRIDNSFPDLQSILDNKESFADFVVRNNLDVQITKDRLILLDKEYSLSAVGKLELQLCYARDIFISIVAFTKVQLVQAPLFEKKIGHIFYEITNTYLHPEKVQLSVLHQTTDRGSLTSVFFITEQKTIFGDVLIRKITVIGGDLDISIYRSIEDNYHTQIFGGPEEYRIYHISSRPITFEEENNLLQALVKGNNIINLFGTLKEVLPTYFTHYNWKLDATIMRHNQLIGYDEMRVVVAGLGSRMTLLESKMADLTQVFAEFKLSQKTIKEVVASLQAKEKIEQALPILDDYQMGLYITLAHGLNEIHMASMVRKELQIDKAGALGSIGSFFSRIAVHIPIAGIAVDFLGCIVTAVGKVQQDRMTRNIADLAIDSFDAANLIKKLSLEIAKSKLRSSELDTKDSILENIANFFDFTADVKSKLIEAMVDSVSSYFVKKESITNERARGENDGQLITKILIGYIAAGHCRLTLNWEDNFDRIDVFFKSRYVIPEVSVLTVDTSDPLPIELLPKTPGNVRQEREKAKELAQEVLKVVKIILTSDSMQPESINIDQDQQVRFIDSLMSALSGENYNSEQRLIYLSQQNSLLRKNIIGELAQQFNKLGAFRMTEETLSIKPKFQVDGGDFIKAMEMTRVFLHTHRYEDHDNIPILIESHEVHYDLDLTFPAGVLMMSMKNLPSFKYLLKEYIPILPLFKGTYVGELCSKYEYPVSVALYSLGASVYGYMDSTGLIYPTISALFFAIREPMHKYRSDLHTSIARLEQSDWVKFVLYTAGDTLADTLTYVAITLPLFPLSPYVIASVAISGFSMSAINYYASQPKTNNLGNVVAFLTTTASIAYCVKRVLKQPDIEDKIMTSDVCINMLPGIHFFSKVTTDLGVDAYNLMLGVDAKNITLEASH